MNYLGSGEGAAGRPVQRLGRQEEEEEPQREVAGARAGPAAEQGGLLGLGRQEIKALGRTRLS